MSLFRRAFYSLGRVFGLSSFYVKCNWDPDAEVWYVESSNVPGLVTEAATTEEMLDKLRVMIPELVHHNKNDQDRIARTPLKAVFQERLQHHGA